MLRNKACVTLAVWMLSVISVTCTSYRQVQTPSLDGDVLQQVYNSITQWFRTERAPFVHQTQLTTSLQADIEYVLRNGAFASGTSSSAVPHYTDHLRFVELGSEDPHWRNFFVPMFSRRWLQPGYSRDITTLSRHVGSNLFILFRAPADYPQGRLSLTKVYAVGVIGGIERSKFEEMFRPPHAADNMDRFWLRHVPTYTAGELGLYVSALHIHP